MKITVIGGGNSAHVAAGYLASKPSYTVNVLTRSPEKWGDTIKVTTKTSSWRQKGTFEGRLNKVSGEAGEVIPGSEVSGGDAESELRTAQNTGLLQCMDAGGPRRLDLRETGSKETGSKVLSKE